MYTKNAYSLADLLAWTRQELVLFAVIATVPALVFDVLGQTWLRLPWLPIALIGTAVAFIIGFQNNATYDRLWEARKIWGGIVNASRGFGLMVQDFISDQFASPPIRSAAELEAERRQLIDRHVAWLTLLRHALRQPRPWERFLAHRTNREWSRAIGVREHRHTVEEELAGCLGPAEMAEVLGKANPAAALMALQSRHLQQLRVRGAIEDFRHMEMAKLLLQLLDLQGRAERIKNFPYPRQYATLNSVLLWVFIVLLPFGVMPAFAEIGNQFGSDDSAIGHWFVWASVPFAVIVMWVFHTMERIGRVSENPFEGTSNDVPITTMARAIEIELRQGLGQDPASIPEPIVASHHALT
ncbi:MAG: bestrophin family ion channel [Planctomycetota bacterium]